MKDKIIITLNIIQLCSIVIGFGALIAAPGARGNDNVFNNIGVIFVGCFTMLIISWVIGRVLSSAASTKKR